MAQRASSTILDSQLPVGALVLAAGYSRRFGGDKLLAPLPGKQQLTVFKQMLDRLSLALDDILIVTRPALYGTLLEYVESTKIQRPSCQISILSFDGSSDGMGASLAFAARHVPNWRAALVCLADMPNIQTDSYSQILTASSRDKIVLPTYEGKRGHPVAFGADFFDELRALHGDQGARDLLTKHSGQITTLQLNDSGILFDIDTPTDLQRQS